MKREPYIILAERYPYSVSELEPTYKRICDSKTFLNEKVPAVKVLERIIIHANMHCISVHDAYIHWEMGQI